MTEWSVSIEVEGTVSEDEADLLLDALGPTAVVGGIQGTFTSARFHVEAPEYLDAVNIARLRLFEVLRGLGRYGLAHDSTVVRVEAVRADVMDRV